MSIRTSLPSSAPRASQNPSKTIRPLISALLTLLSLSSLCAQADEGKQPYGAHNLIVRVLTLSGLNFDRIPDLEETAIFGATQRPPEDAADSQEVPLTLILGQAPRRFSLRCNDSNEHLVLSVRQRNSSSSFSVTHLPSLECPFGTDRGFKRASEAIYLWIEQANPEEPLKLRERKEVLTTLVRHLTARAPFDRPTPFFDPGELMDQDVLTLFTAIPTISDVPEADRRQLIQIYQQLAKQGISEELSLNMEIARLLLGDRLVFDNWLQYPDQGPSWGLDLKTRTMNLLARTHDDPKFRGRLLLPLLKRVGRHRIQGADQLLEDLRAGRIAIEASPEEAKAAEQRLTAHASTDDFTLFVFLPLLGGLAIFGWAFAVRRSTQFLLFR